MNVNLGREVDTARHNHGLEKFPRRGTIVHPGLYQSISAWRNDILRGVHYKHTRAGIKEILLLLYDDQGVELGTYLSLGSLQNQYLDLDDVVVGFMDESNIAAASFTIYLKRVSNPSLESDNEDANDSNDLTYHNVYKLPIFSSSKEPARQARPSRKDQKTGTKVSSDETLIRSTGVHTSSSKDKENDTITKTPQKTAPENQVRQSKRMKLSSTKSQTD